MSPTISIIIPIYKVEEYIADCLRSVLSQSYRHIEVLCVDDCGLDASVKIAEDFAAQDSRVKIVRHSTNKGLGPARNTGMDASCGEYIFFLDSDDMLYPDTLEKLLGEALSTGADVTAGRVIAFPQVQDEQLVTFAEQYNKYDSTAPSGLSRFLSGEQGSHCLQLSVVAHGRLFSASFLKEEKLRFIDQKVVHEDNGFFCKYLSCRPLVAITDIPAIQYRIRPGSIMTSQEDQASIERRQQHLELVLSDARSYIESKLGKELAEYLLCILHHNSTPFLCKYGRVFQIQWGRFEKTLRILGVPIYKEWLNYHGYKIYRILCVKVWKDKNPLGLV